MRFFCKAGSSGLIGFKRSGFSIDNIALCRAPLWILFLVLMSAGLVQPAAGQSLPSQSGTITRPPAERLPPPERVGEPKFRLPTIEEESAIPDTGDQALVLKSVRVTGATAVDAAVLSAISAPYLGQTVPVSRLFQIRNKIETEYRREGFILTRVVLPEQELEPTGADVELRVIEGVISDVLVQGDVGDVEALIKRIVGKLVTGRPANLVEIERQLLLVQDIPGISTRARFAPAPGTVGGSLLTIDVVRTPVAGFLSTDNRGANFAGPWQLALGLSTNSFTEFGERVEAYLFTTPNREQRYGQVAISSTLTSDGLSMRLYGGYGPAHPGGTLGQAGFVSDVTSAGLSLTYPILRGRTTNLWVTGGLEMNNSNINLRLGQAANDSVSESYLRIARISIKGSHVDGWNGYTELTLGLDKGLQVLGATPRDSSKTARPDSEADAARLVGRLSRRQGVYADDAVTIDLLAMVAGQYGFEVQRPSQKAQLGGLEFGRGYYFGQLTGDRSVMSSLELTAMCPVNWFSVPASVGPFAFDDAGVVWDIAPGDPGRRYLHSAGGGVRLELDRWFSAEVEYARRLVRNPTRANDLPLDPNRVSVRFIGRF